MATFTPATPEEREQLGEHLDAFNRQATGRDDDRAVGYAIHDDAGKLVGGISGEIGYGWLYVGILWLDASLRGQGLGTKLLQQLEADGRAAGCRNACLTTFSYQALPFYLSHGYEEFGRLDDYPEGESMHFLRKSLSEN